MARTVLVPNTDHPITVAPYEGRVVVSRDGQLVADTRAALRLQEASYPAVYYVPRDDADFSVLEPTEHATYCPYKGDASYFTVRTGATPAENAVWTYEEPYDAVAPIRGYLAFYADRVDIRVED
jgi:uncharacterized protein (DUF427 family)